MGLHKGHALTRVDSGGRIVVIPYFWCSPSSTSIEGIAPAGVAADISSNITPNAPGVAAMRVELDDDLAFEHV